MIVDGALEAFGCLVGAGGDATGVLQLVEAPLDRLTQTIEPAVDGDPQLTSFAHGDDWHHVAHFHGLINEWVTNLTAALLPVLAE